MKPKVIVLFVLSMLITTLLHAQQPGRAIQINIDTLLNARPVTTLTGGKLVTWTKGIDGGGQGDGYLTMKAASFNGDKDPHALPNNPFIDATPAHPAIKLHYQTGMGSKIRRVMFLVPVALGFMCRQKDIWVCT